MGIDVAIRVEDVFAGDHDSESGDDHAERTERVCRRVAQHALEQRKFQFIIADECHSIKSTKAQRTQAVMPFLMQGILETALHPIPQAPPLA